MNAILLEVFPNRDVLTFLLFPLTHQLLIFLSLFTYLCFYLLSFFTCLPSFSFIRFYFHPEDPKNISCVVPVLW